MRMLGRAAGAALAAMFVVSVAPLASGETPSPSHAATAAPAKHGAHKKPAHSKKKRTPRRAVTVKAQRSTRLAFAASASPEWSEALVDEAQLPPVSPGWCASEMVSIEGRFCVDRWEASLVEVSSGGERPFPFNEKVEGRTVRAVSSPDVLPQGYVSGVEAGEACAHSGKRLCSRMEWRKACVGPQKMQFGYAQQRERGRCNDAARSPMLAIWGSSALSEPGDWDPIKMNDARLNALPGALAPTGSHSGCTNDYGVFDMVGNLHEWTSDPNGTFQGGYYLDTTLNGDGCAYKTTAHDFAYHDYSTGFRCCADPH